MEKDMLVKMKPEVAGLSVLSASGQIDVSHLSHCSFKDSVVVRFPRF